jgi:hypothetical protein
MSGSRGIAPSIGVKKWRNKAEDRSVCAIVVKEALVKLQGPYVKRWRKKAEDRSVCAIVVKEVLVKL